MRYVCLFLTLAATACGPAIKHKPPLANVHVDAVNGESMRLVVTRSDKPSRFCADQAEGLVCEVTDQYLYDQAQLAGFKWGKVEPPLARQICRDMMWSVVRFDIRCNCFVPVSSQLVNACAFELLYLQAIVMPPEPPPPGEPQGD